MPESAVRLDERDDRIVAIAIYEGDQYAVDEQLH